MKIKKSILLTSIMCHLSANGFATPTPPVLLLSVTHEAFSMELDYPTTCPPNLKINANENITCGYATVPEKHHFRNGKKIKIFFMNAKAISNKQKLAPILYLMGGGRAHPPLPICKGYWMKLKSGERVMMSY